MRLYEGMFLVDNSEARRDYESVSQNVASIIRKHGGEVKHSERWAECRLAYSVKRRDRGTYILVYFDASPESIDQIRRDCVIDEVILRTMILKADSMPEKKGEPEAAPEPAEVAKTPATEGAEPVSPAPEPEAPPEPVSPAPEPEAPPEPVSPAPEPEASPEPVEEVAVEPVEEVAAEPVEEVAAEPVQELPEAGEEQKTQDSEEEPVAVTGDEPADEPTDDQAGQGEELA